MVRVIRRLHSLTWKWPPPLDECNRDSMPTDQSFLGHLVGSETNTGMTGCTSSNLVNAGGNTIRTGVGSVTQLVSPADCDCRISGAPLLSSRNVTATIISAASGEPSTMRPLYFLRFAASIAADASAVGPPITVASRTLPDLLSTSFNKTVRVLVSSSGSPQAAA